MKLQLRGLMTYSKLKRPPFCSDQRSGVAGITLQQQSEWHPGWWDGSRKNDPDHRPHHLPHGVQAPQRALPHHCTSLVSHNMSFSVLWACLWKHKLKNEKCLKRKLYDHVFMFICWVKTTYELKPFWTKVLCMLSELYQTGSMSLISGHHLS